MAASIIWTNLSLDVLEHPKAIFRAKNNRRNSATNSIADTTIKNVAYIGWFTGISTSEVDELIYASFSTQ